MFENDRSFTIVKVKNNNNTTMRVSGGRYISSNPSSAVKKMFSHICRNMRKNVIV
jgi:predicted Fe-Mo cluster-binding NifX family protein